MTEPAIEFDAIVYKVQTLADHGLRVTFDLPEDAIPQMAMLAECKRAGIALRIVATAQQPKVTNDKPNTTKRARF